MFTRKSISLLLSFALVLSLAQTSLTVVTAADVDTYTSNALTVNGEATTWTVLGERPADFEDLNDPVRLAYYDDDAMNFELQHEKAGIAEGIYQLSMELFSEDANPSKTETPSPAAYLYAETSEGTYSTPIVYTGSAWTAPATLTLKNIEVGSDGKVVVGLKMESAAKHYGYVRNMQLIQMPAFESYTSNSLTFNNEPVTWVVLGSKPSQFGDGNEPAGLEYYDVGEMDFELQHERTDVTEGYYELSMQLFSSDANPSKTETPSPLAYLYAETSEGSYSTPIVYTGSAWTAPATLTLKNIEVGSDSKVVVGLKMVSAADHYGYVRNMLLTPSSAPAKINVKPNSAILRPGNTVQLATNTNSEQQVVVFTVSDEQIATVNEHGLVTAVGNGEAIITATVLEDGEVIATATSQIYVSDTLQSGYSAIQVEPVDELEGEQRSDFIMGADISMLDALSAIDRKYYSAEGEETPLLELLTDNGVNWARLRAWVDPSDENGNPYGAGNVDTAALVRMAAQVKAAGMKLLVDLHYSDFWTDPGRQSMPKSWVKETEALTTAELEQEVYDYTYDILQALYEQDAYPDMIQIGNEINGGMLWPYGNSAEKAKPYIQQGIQAVRDFESDVDGQHLDIVIHRANPGDGLARLTSFYSTYADLDYDVIGLSYYPFWHGTLANLQQVMNELAEQFDKEIAIVETSYAYTLEDTIYNGATGHIFGQAQVNASNYLATPQGQANAIRDVIAAVAAVPDNMGAGIFYWEPAWLMGTDTGWGTTYAASYQKEEIATDGGSGWANQALFNYFGEALPSLHVFSAVRASKDEYVEPEIVSVDSITITTSEGVTVAPPSQVRALYSDDTYRMIEVKSWTPADYDYNSPGEYKLVGDLGNEKTITATITVRPKNYVINPGIEISDMSAWQLVNASRSTDAAYSGQYAIHFWNQASLSAKQVITNIPEGVYELSVQTRIGIEGDSISDESVLYAKSGEETYATKLEVTGWESWQKIVVTDIEVRSGQLEIGVIVENALNDYGDFDDWELIRIGDLPGTPPEPPPSPTPTPTEQTSSDTVLTTSTNNGETILKATVSAETASLTIPLVELENKTNAQLVLSWGEQTITIALAELKQFLPVSSTGSIVIERSVDEERPLSLAGGSVTTVLSPVEWRVTLQTENGQERLEIPVAFTVDLDREQVLGISTMPAYSLALYTVASNGTLTYVRGMEVSNDPSTATSLLLQSGKLYTVASVTRQFNDIAEQSPAVRRLVAAGILQGDHRGAVHLKQQATRAEVSKLTAMLLELIEQEPANEVNDASNTARVFTDLPNNHWAKPYIDQLTAKELLRGVSEQSFAPNAAMSYEALIVMVARLLQLPLDVDDNDSIWDQVLAMNANGWAQPSIAAVTKKGLLSPSELQETNLTSAVTREQLFELFYSILEKEESY